MLTCLLFRRPQFLGVAQPLQTDQSFRAGKFSYRKAGWERSDLTVAAI